MKILKSLCAILFACSCSHQLVIKNAEFCSDVGDKGALCFLTNTDETRDLKAAEWKKERFGMICTSPENFANWKEALLKACEIYECKYENAN